MAKERRNKHYSNNQHHLREQRKRDREWLDEARRKLETDKPADGNLSPGSFPMEPGREYDVG